MVQYKRQNVYILPYEFSWNNSNPMLYVNQCLEKGYLELDIIGLYEGIGLPSTYL